MINFVPAILTYKDYSFCKLSEIDEEIARLQKDNDSFELLSGLMSYRSDIIEFAKNVDTNELIKNIVSEWLNYEKASRYRDLGYVRTFYRSISFFTFCLHVKLNLKSEGI